MFPWPASSSLGCRAARQEKAHRVVSHDNSAFSRPKKAPLEAFFDDVSQPVGAVALTFHAELFEPGLLTRGVFWTLIWYSHLAMNDCVVWVEASSLTEA